MKRALFVWGGWDGHTPKESAEVFAPWLRGQGYEVELRDTLAAYDDAARLKTFDLIIPTWTMGQIAPEQERNLCDAVRSGVGLAGWHGTMGDSFRGSIDYMWMVGGQFVSHPGNLRPSYAVHILDRTHPITEGLPDFSVPNSEQYYMLVDPANHVLAATRFEDGTVMPAVWTKRWGEGRVAYASFGHTDKDFDVPAARTIMQRALLWATR
jgi:hypothetical protein